MTGRFAFAWRVLRIFSPAGSYTGYISAKGERRCRRLKTVIYLDVLLLTNFLIAYAMLAATGLLAGRRASFLRMIVGSLIASAAALILFAPELPYPVQLAYKLVTAAIIVWMAFGIRPLRTWLTAVCWYTALNLLLAGLCILVILQTDTPLLQTGNLAVYLRISPVLLLLLAGLCCLVVWFLLRFLSAPKGVSESAGLELDLCGVTVRLRAALDTGCHLKDPITCLPVLLVSYPNARSRLPAEACQFLDGWFSGQNPEAGQSGLSLRLIPCTTATGRSILPGFSVRQIGLITPQGVLSLGRSAIAFTQQSFQGDYEALYGSDFL